MPDTICGTAVGPLPGGPQPQRGLGPDLAGSERRALGRCTVIGRWVAAEVLPWLLPGAGVALAVTGALAVWAWKEHRRQPPGQPLRIGMEQTVEMPRLRGRRRRTRTVVQHQQCTGRAVRRG